MAAASIVAASLTSIFFFSRTANPRPSSHDILDKRAILESQTFLKNRDWDWYERNIPFFDSPDADINRTYYYRWELITRHKVYGSPATGYTFTEFTDRPGWSGAYGAISCAAGHHLNELRWIKDPQWAQDYARYWFRTPGAQPRNYSTWLADGVWSVYKVQLNRDFTVELEPDLIKNYAGWTQEHFDSSVGMFWQTGMADGMETNINSRQTADWFAGAQGYRPTLNAYMYADSLAISRIAALKGDSQTVETYAKKAADIKAHVQRMLWDPSRHFFLHMFRHDEQNGIKALTRTYETGPYAGNPHGREEIGFVPWEFDLPDPGYEAAWKYLLDPNYFGSPYGPTTTERHDPLFLISKNCCVWSGQSWPYATTQTLEAMANLLNDYSQNVVSKEDFFSLVKTYTRTQQKDGHPYIAESANPDTGSWSGSDTFNHSEHYFHSGYNDIIITGLSGLRPQSDNRIVVNPLIPADWNWFALDDVRYHGHRISIVWDRDGVHYHRGAGLTLFVDGRKAASSREIGKLQATLGAAAPTPSPTSLLNYAVNNEAAFFPHVSASSLEPRHSLTQVNDGAAWYDISPPNRWVSATGNASDWCGVNFGIDRPISQVKLYLIDDGPTTDVGPPHKVEIQYRVDGSWRAVPSQSDNPVIPAGSRPLTFSFPQVRTSAIRAVLTHPEAYRVGMSEIEAWGPGTAPVPQPKPMPGNIALNRSGIGFPKASASYTSRYDRIEELNDGITSFGGEHNRWTAFDSPNRTDWVQIDFGAAKPVSTLMLAIWADGGGVQAPEGFTIQIWNGSDWVDTEMISREPTVPTAGTINVVHIRPITTNRVRIVFKHPKGSFSGVSELGIYSTDPTE